MTEHNKYSCDDKDIPKLDKCVDLFISNFWQNSFGLNAFVLAKKKCIYYTDLVNYLYLAYIYVLSN